MIKCPFCGSINTKCLSISDAVYKRYEIADIPKVLYSKNTKPRNYSIFKAICMNCSYAFEKMSDVYTEENEKQKYF